MAHRGTGKGRGPHGAGSTDPGLPAEPAAAAAASGGGDQDEATEVALAALQALSITNGQINKMHVDQLRNELQQRRLSSAGNKKVLSKRLKEAAKRAALAASPAAGSYLGGRTPPMGAMPEFLCVIDFEATCEEGNREFPHEIIEFPVVLIDVQARAVVASKQWYVRPTRNPMLTAFCTELTGIRQEEVDGSEEFPAVLAQFNAWLDEHGLGTEHSFAVATDGPWDLRDFMYLQCQQSQLPMPSFCGTWVDIRKHFSSFYKERCGITAMLSRLGLEFEGREHSGIDDSRNIARIAIQMLKDGRNLVTNWRMEDCSKRHWELRQRLKRA